MEMYGDERMQVGRGGQGIPCHISDLVTDKMVISLEQSHTLRPNTWTLGFGGGAGCILWERKSQHLASTNQRAT